MFKRAPKKYNEVELHYVGTKQKSLVQIKGTNDIVEIIRDFYNPKKINLKEFYWGIFLTHSNHVLGFQRLVLVLLKRLSKHKGTLPIGFKDKCIKNRSLHTIIQEAIQIRQ